MAPNNILKELEGVNFSCSSDLAASSTTCTVDEQHSSMLTSLGSSGRAIDRFSPHLRDPLRARSLNPELMTQYSPATTTNNKPKLSAGSSSSSRSSRKQQQVIISPASSSRYLLSGSASDVDVQLWDSTQAPAAVVVSEAASEAWRFQSSAAKVLQSSTVVKAEIDPSTFQSINLEQSTTTSTRDDPDSSSSSSSSSCSNSSSRPQNHQVVVLRVSLHCKGCELKVRKHLSKMEGVTSFTTDLVNKKVTVAGDVTPLGVLNSISKVKNAQLWRSLPPTSSSSTKILSYS